MKISLSELTERYSKLTTKELIDLDRSGEVTAEARQVLRAELGRRKIDFSPGGGEMQKFECPFCHHVVQDYEADWDEAVNTGKCPSCGHLYHLAARERSEGEPSGRLQVVEATWERVIKIWWWVAWRSTLAGAVATFLVLIVIFFFLGFVGVIVPKGAGEDIGSLAGMATGLVVYLYFLKKVLNHIEFSDFMVVLVKTEPGPHFLTGSQATALTVDHTIEARLHELKELRDQKLITPEDYEQKRVDILKEL